MCRCVSASILFPTNQRRLTVQFSRISTSKLVVHFSGNLDRSRVPVLWRFKPFLYTVVRYRSPRRSFTPVFIFSSFLLRGFFIDLEPLLLSASTWDCPLCSIVYNQTVSKDLIYALPVSIMYNVICITIKYYFIQKISNALILATQACWPCLSENTSTQVPSNVVSAKLDGRLVTDLKKSADRKDISAFDDGSLTHWYYTCFYTQFYFRPRRKAIVKLTTFVRLDFYMKILWLACNCNNLWYIYTL